jgi:hypothetical protein
MLVATVTAPRRPACATISPSRSTFSGRAFSTYRQHRPGRQVMYMLYYPPSHGAELRNLVKP